MNIIAVDFETYYDKSYSLSKMQTEEYIGDSRFEAILVTVYDGGVMHTYTGTHQDIAQQFAAHDWVNSAVVCHHTHFDGLILETHFGIRPKLWMDTLALARMHFPWLKSHSLASVAKHMGLPAKGDTVHSMLGRTRASLTQAELDAYAAYCAHDTLLCYTICMKLADVTAPLELKLIDMTVRMFTEPLLVGDVQKMQDLYVGEINRKNELLTNSHVMKDTIMSNVAFAAALSQLGVIPPMKLSKTTGRMTHAFAKTDKDFTDLLEHPDPDVQALVAARLGVKSTIAETRAARFLRMAQSGPLRVYLGFWGAKTTGRYSGGNSVNWQNLPARGPVAGLRKGIAAPPGRVVVVGDSSNIELRVVMAAAGQTDVLDKLRAGVDLYCDFASALMGRTITKADVGERFLGKVAMLSLQYGAGAERFCEMVRLAARSDPTGALKPISMNEAQAIVDLYRRRHPMVVRLWNYCQEHVLPDIARGGSLAHVDVHGWCITYGEGFSQPGQRGVVYHDLRFADNEWTYLQGAQRVRIYGPKVVENLCIDGAARVLTDCGWLPLRDITTERVHDGVGFVDHGGTIFKGVRPTVEVDGVRMTHDHEVLTDEGWKNASQVQEPYRPNIRVADSAAAAFVEKRQMAVAFSLYVREREDLAGSERHTRSSQRGYSELWVRHRSAYLDQEPYAWYEQTPGVRGLPGASVTMPASFARCVEELWGPGYPRVRPMVGGFLEFLGGYGSFVSAGADTGPCGQQRPLRAGKLSLGRALGSGQQPPGAATDEFVGTESPVRSAEVDALVPLEQGAARGGAVSSAETEVWDILNCGPRNRFVVLGANGPFIVHNCQHLARQIVMWQTARINEREPVKLSVHDEAVTVPLLTDLLAVKDYMVECLSLAPRWCRGDIPLACEVKHGATYGDAK